MKRTENGEQRTEGWIGTAIVGFVYNAGLILFSFFYLPVFIFKGKFGPGWRMRFGQVPDAIARRLKEGSVVWLHAVSVGEIGLAVRWAEHLRERMPEAKILFTTTTAAGYEVASKIKSDKDELCFFPIDWPGSVTAFVRSVDPKLVLFFETEIWPNMINQLSVQNTPVFIVNGRLSDRSFARYRLVRALIRPILNRLSGIGVQDETMRRRFIALGVDPDKVSVTGNLKFEWQPPLRMAETAHSYGAIIKKSGDFIWLCASTHEGEEEVVFDTFLAIGTERSIRLILAPRHVSRVPEVEKLAQKRGICVRKLSQDFVSSGPHDQEEVFLIDRMGELASFYSLADAVFVGGSLVPVGGHNPVEPAYYAKPVLYGPFMQNFQSMKEVFEEGRAALCVADGHALKLALEEMMRDGQKAAETGRVAQALVRRHQGAAQKNLDYVMWVLEKSFGRRTVSV